MAVKEKETEDNAFDEQEFTDYCCDILKEAMSERIGFNSYVDR